MNIVFDLGGVLFHWEPEKLMAAHFPDPAEAALIDRHLHRHRDWAELDRGTLFYEEAARRSSERSGLPVERIERFLQAVAPSLTPREDTVALLRDVKNSGHPLYLLSNMHYPVIPFLEQHPFMNLFDGKIYSSLVHQVKPDREIYQTLLDRFSLTPRETLFIDDSPINLPEAAALGIQTHHFTEADLCRRDLVKRGVSL